jgi:D-alanyl-D-alanine dipeptidase
MRDAGFKNYHREWWHFDFSGEPFPETYYDFPVTAPPS